MSFPIVTNSGGQIGTGLLYSNVVYFAPYSYSFSTTRTISWTVPVGVTKCRVRLWGGGGGSMYGSTVPRPGGGGGFALKTVTVTPGSAVVVTIGGAGPNNNPGTGGTSSFGGYVSATGGQNQASGATVTGGVGSLGDINMYGCGKLPSNNGGNAGNLFIPYSGSSNEFDTVFTPVIIMGNPTNPLDKIGTGYLFGTPVLAPLMNWSGQGGSLPAQPFIGNGLGGLETGGGYTVNNGPGYPGGGAGQYYYYDGGFTYVGHNGAAGLVIVEY